MSDVSCEVKEVLCSLSEYNGWSKEVRLVSWNGKKDVVDIRSWNEETGKCGKGITLSIDEAIQLRDTLNEMDL